MGYHNIEFKIDGTTAQITMNRPEALNALNSQVFVELNSAL